MARINKLGERPSRKGLMSKEEAKASPWELRQIYGNHIDKHNTFMPLCHYMPIAFEIQASVTWYKNIVCSKFPMDAWVMQEIIYKNYPTVIIEIGNFHGGSALMLSDWLMGTPEGRLVIGVDISHLRLDEKVREHPHIAWVEGDAKSEETVERVKKLLKPSDRVMIIDDSSHTTDHTYGVLNAYCDLVTPGQYFIVEDTILGNIMPRSHGEFGADIAVDMFLKERGDFRVVTYWQKWFLTCCPGGFLQKLLPEEEIPQQGDRG